MKISRKCTKCLVELNIENFYSIKQGSGHKTQCKRCIKTIEKKRRDSSNRVVEYRKSVVDRVNLFNNGNLKCSICKKKLDLSKFSLEPKGWKGFRSDCNDCKNKRNREYAKKTGWKKDYMKSYLSNPHNKLADRLRSRLRKAIKNNQKVGSAVNELGCSIEEFKMYMENLFLPDMSWDNWSLKGWHIDHIKPLGNFDLTKREELLIACHYTNLQPLWAKDNLSKGAKYDEQ